MNNRRKQINSLQGFTSSFMTIISVFTALAVLTASGCQKRMNSVPAARTTITAPEDYVVIGYIAGWIKRLNPDDIPVEKLTHLNYAFSVIDTKNNPHSMIPYHPDDTDNFKKLGELKKRNPRLKVLISAGGWDGSRGFSDMALRGETREKFIGSAMAFIEKYGFDGLDLDWEYPALPGAGNTCRPEDTRNFTLLLRECRAALEGLEKKNGRKYLLTMAAGAFLQPLKLLELGEIHRYLDYINLMTYDFAGSWDSVSGHHSNLHLSASNPDREGPSVVQAVDYCLSQKFPAHQIVVGIAFYGRGWRMAGAEGNGLYQKASGNAEGDFSFASLTHHYIGKNGFRRFYDETAQAPYLWNADKKIFITYEDEMSAGAKCAWVKSRRLGGVMFWQLYEDDECRLVDAICRNLH